MKNFDIQLTEAGIIAVLLTPVKVKQNTETVLMYSFDVADQDEKVNWYGTDSGTSKRTYNFKYH